MADGMTNRLIFRVAACLSGLLYQAVEQIFFLRGPSERKTLIVCTAGLLWAFLKCSFPWRVQLPVDFVSADVL